MTCSFGRTNIVCAWFGYCLCRARPKSGFCFCDADLHCIVRLHIQDLSLKPLPEFRVLRAVEMKTPIGCLTSYMQANQPSVHSSVLKFRPAPWITKVNTSISSSYECNVTIITTILTTIILSFFSYCIILRICAIEWRFKNSSFATESFPKNPFKELSVDLWSLLLSCSRIWEALRPGRSTRWDPKGSRFNPNLWFTSSGM